MQKESEIAAIRDAAIKRALNTPHKPHKPLNKKPRKRLKRKNKAG